MMNYLELDYMDEKTEGVIDRGSHYIYKGNIRDINERKIQFHFDKPLFVDGNITAVGGFSSEKSLYCSGQIKVCSDSLVKGRLITKDIGVISKIGSILIRVWGDVISESMSIVSKIKDVSIDIKSDDGSVYTNNLTITSSVSTSGIYNYSGHIFTANESLYKLKRIPESLLISKRESVLGDLDVPNPFRTLADIKSEQMTAESKSE